MSDALRERLQAIVPQANLAAQTLPGCEAIRLWLLRDDFPRGRLPQEQVSNLLDAPPYWSFCWASGVAMAAHLLAHPELVRGKRVVDFGSGSGVMAIAAAKSGASEVVAVDIDPDALLATSENARLNGVDVTVVSDMTACRLPADVLLATDVLYDRDNYALLDFFREWAQQIYVADSRVKQFPEAAYGLQHMLRATTFPDLGEPEEFSEVRVYGAVGKVNDRDSTPDAE